jgi:hypothetical protein
LAHYEDANKHTITITTAIIIIIATAINLNTLTRLD